MNGHFTKLAASLTDSTLWAEPDRTRIVWITMLAMADPYGRVLASVPGLANRARVPIADTEIALTAFLSPDPYSRTKDHEGRRLVEIDGGWRLLNHGKYRELRAKDDRLEQNRLAQQRSRERKRAEKASATVSTGQQPSAESAASANTEAEAEAKKEKKSSKRASTKEPGFLDDVNPELLTDWLPIRKAKRAGPITATVARLFRNEAAKAGLTLEAAVTACIQYTWGTFDAGWYSDRQAKKTNTPSGSPRGSLAGIEYPT